MINSICVKKANAKHSINAQIPTGLSALDELLGGGLACNCIHLATGFGVEDFVQQLFKNVNCYGIAEGPLKGGKFIGCEGCELVFSKYSFDRNSVNSFYYPLDKTYFLYSARPSHGMKFGASTILNFSADTKRITINCEKNRFGPTGTCYWGV